MNTTRQDAWSQEEDSVLCDTVLQFIRNGSTQLEAFKKVAVQLSRTPAACGFRWNATLRKQCSEEIKFAKDERKKGNKQRGYSAETYDIAADDQLETTISFLEKMKSGMLVSAGEEQRKLQMQLESIKQENESLKEKLQDYENVWSEMGNLWRWVADRH